VQRRHGEKGVQLGDRADRGATPRGARARDQIAGTGPATAERELAPQAGERAAERVHQEREAHLVGLASLPGGLPRGGHFGRCPVGAPALGLGAVPFAIALGDGGGEVPLGPLAQLVGRPLGGGLRVAGRPQRGPLLGDAPAQLLVLVVALLPGRAGMGAGLGELAAQPFELDGELVHSGQRGVTLGTQLPRLAPACCRCHGLARVLVVVQECRGGGHERVVGGGGELAGAVLLPPGHDGSAERRGRFQLGGERGAAELGPLGGREPREPPQRHRDVHGRHRADGRGREIGEPGAHGLRQLGPVDLPGRHCGRALLGRADRAVGPGHRYRLSAFRPVHR
jgi:hypothetical protein